MHIHRLRSLPALAAITATLSLAACAGAPTDTTSATTAPTAGDTTAFAPVTLTNCGVKVTVAKPPTHLVTLNQGATEVALSLGLEAKMAGTAYLDDQIAKPYAAAYAKVPVLAKEYPSKEKFLAAQPDFAYAAYSSAFEDKAVGTRQELAGEKIGTYLSPFGCPKGTAKAPATFESAWKEISDVGSIFGVRAKADTVISAQKTRLNTIRSTAAGKGRTVLWYDSGDKTPFVGAGGGGPQLILDSVGATNIFKNLQGGWADGAWEKVVAAKPDVIVLADASWDTAAKKKKYLESDPVLRTMPAVKNKAYVVLPFSASTPGARLVDGAATVSQQLAVLKTK